MIDTAQPSHPLTAHDLDAARDDLRAKPVESFESPRLTADDLRAAPLADVLLYGLTLDDDDPRARPARRARKAGRAVSARRRQRGALGTAPEASPASGTRVRNPLAGESFRALRELRVDFGRGGLPPRDRRTPEDEARIAAFFVLQELNHLLDQFRRAIEQGEHRRLVVSEHGRQLGKVVIEMTIEDTDQ